MPAPAYPTAMASRSADALSSPACGDVEHRRGGLLDDLLVAALHRAVAHSDRPRRALPVGDDLDLDVPGAGDQLLEEDHARAEGPLRLVAGALVGVRQLGVRGDLADAAPAAARGGLEHERVADPGRRGRRVLEGVDPAPAPRGDRHADLLGDQLGADLVAEPAHRLGARPDERHARSARRARRSRVLGDEAPADPGGVGPASRAGPAPAPRGRGRDAATRGRGRRRHPPRARTSPTARPRCAAPRSRCGGHRARLRVEVAHGVDEPHRGLSAVDDGDPLEHRWSSRVRCARRLGRRSGRAVSRACHHLVVTRE